MKSLSACAAIDPHYCWIYFATYEITECQCSHRSSLLLYILCYLWNHWVPVQPQILIIAVYTLLLMKSLSASAAADPHYCCIYCATYEITECQCATDPHYCCIYCATYEITECQCSHRSSLLLYILCYLWNHWVPVQPQILIIAVYTVLLMKSLSASAPQILIIAVYTVLPLKSLSASAATDPHYCCIYFATYEITECQCSRRSSLLLYILCYLWNHWVPVRHRSSLLLYILCYLWNHWVPVQTQILVIAVYILCYLWNDWVPVQPQILIIAVYTVLLMKSLSASAATDPHYCCIYFATYEITECQCSQRSSLLLYILCYLWNHWVPVQPQILIIAVYTVLLMKSLSASTATDPH